MQSMAIIGSGISGLGLAWLLRGHYQITVFESDSHAGGHANTSLLEEDERKVSVDTGFMVYNRVTYPNLVRLFELLEVPVKRTEMSFSVQHLGRGLEYAGSSLNHLFAQRSNLLRPSYYRMLAGIHRFNSEALEGLQDPSFAQLSLEDYVRRRGYGEDFLHLYLIPMSSAVWSTPPEKMLRFPARTLLRFFHNHGFLGLSTQHPWWTVEGGSRCYVERLLASLGQRVHLNTPIHRVTRTGQGVSLSTATETLLYDKVVFACHPPTALSILGDQVLPSEHVILRNFHYQANRATLHSDASVMPRRRLAWSSWNYRLAPTAPGLTQAAELEVSTHYWMNSLQCVSRRKNYFVSINGENLPAPSSVYQRIDYEHPLFDDQAVRAQLEIPDLNARALNSSRTFFVGAWQRYGFHEDGLFSAVRLATQLLGGDPWTRTS